MPKKRAGPTDTVIGSYIRACREAAGMTQAMLAVILEVRQQQVDKYEKGKNRLSHTMLGELERLFDRTLDQFVSETTPSQPASLGFAEEAQAYGQAPMDQQAKPYAAEAHGPIAPALLTLSDPVARKSLLQHYNALKRWESRSDRAAD